MPKSVKTWMKGGLWLAFFLLGLWVALRVYGHQVWYSGEPFTSVVDQHVAITLFSLVVAGLGVMINIRLGLAALLIVQAVLSAISSSLARMKGKWEAPDLHPDFVDTHTQDLAQIFQIISLVSLALLIMVLISMFWKAQTRKAQ